MSDTPNRPPHPPRSAARKAEEKAIHRRYSGRKVPMEELLGDLEHLTTMGEWHESHKAMVELKRLRQQRNLTPRDMAKRTGLTEDSIRELEEGQVTGPHLDALTRYAHALDKRVFVQLADAS